jgi:hypothetical protein
VRVLVSTQPFTFAGVAGFARASWIKLVTVQAVTALLSAAICVWFVATNWNPVVKQAISRLPDDGSIHDGVLQWKGSPALALADGKFLSLAVDLELAHATAAPADLQVELGRTHLVVRSFLGYAPIRYPRGWVIEMDRLELEARWGAWQGAVFLGIGVVVVLALFVSWSMLASVYMWVVWMVGFYSDREIGSSSAWRLSAAALIPGAVLLASAIFAYGVQRINLLQLTLAFVLHFAVGWAYSIGAIFRLPSIHRTSKNPFQSNQ